MNIRIAFKFWCASPLKFQSIAKHSKLYDFDFHTKNTILMMMMLRPGISPQLLTIYTT